MPAIAVIEVKMHLFGAGHTLEADFGRFIGNHNHRYAL
jgi:hypothetical protein